LLAGARISWPGIEVLGRLDLVRGEAHAGILARLALERRGRETAISGIVEIIIGGYAAVLTTTGYDHRVV
jgi:hypothetical protein